MLDVGKLFISELAGAFADGHLSMGTKKHDRDLRDTHSSTFLGRISALAKRHNCATEYHGGLEQMPKGLVAVFRATRRRGFPQVLLKYGEQLQETDGKLWLVPHFGV